MDGILVWGLETIRIIQSAKSVPLTFLMKAITFLGSEYAYLAMLPLFYWCYDERKALRLAFVVLLSAWLNLFLKELWMQPRPYDLDPSVGMASEKTSGFPSGHAQGSVGFWGIAASWMRGPAAIALAVFMPLAIGFTRVYLGVHFPTDVLAGWAVGGLILAAYFAFGRFLETLFIKADRRLLLLGLTALVFVLNALHPQDVSLGAVIFGMGTGCLLMTGRFPFSASAAADGSAASVPVKALRYALGMAGAALIYFGLKAVFPGEASPSYSLFRFVRYGLLGFWVAAGAPALFLRLKLVGAR